MSNDNWGHPTDPANSSGDNNQPPNDDSFANSSEGSQTFGGAADNSNPLDLNNGQSAGSESGYGYQAPADPYNSSQQANPYGQSTYQAGYGAADAPTNQPQSNPYGQSYDSGTSGTYNQTPGFDNQNQTNPYGQSPYSSAPSAESSSSYGSDQANPYASSGSAAAGGFSAGQSDPYTAAGSADSYGGYGSAQQPNPYSTDSGSSYGQSADYGYQQPYQDTSSYGSYGGYNQPSGQPGTGYANTYGTPTDSYGEANYGVPSGYDGQSLYGPVGMGTPNYANWGMRVVSYLIDIGIPSAIIGAITAAAADAEVVGVVLNLVFLAWFGYNTVYLGGTTGQTWGRKVAKTRLVSANTGQPIGPLMALVRHIAHFVDSLICMIGWLFPLWDQKRQTIADKLVSTVVIDESHQAPQAY